MHINTRAVRIMSRTQNLENRNAFKPGEQK